MDIEFVDGNDPDPAAAEALDVSASGPRWLRPRTRQPRRMRSWTWLAVAALVLGVAALTQGPSNSPFTGPSSAASTPRAPSPSSDAALSGGFAAVLALAHHRGRLADYIRQTSPPGACATVAVGYSPVRAIVRTAASYVPRLMLVDSAQTLDQFTGLCAVQLRATFPRRSLLTVSVSAPPNGQRAAAFARIETGIITIDGITTKYATTVTIAGWRVVVGVTGPNADAVSSQDLLALAQRPSLLW